MAFYKQYLFVMGDSVASGYAAYGRIPAAHSVAKVNVSARSADYQIPLAKSANSPLILTSMGMNDWGVSTNTFITSYTAFLKKLRAQLPNSVILVGAITPTAAVNKYPNVSPRVVTSHNIGLKKMVKSFNDPKIIYFDAYSVGACLYGTPYYITIDERKQLYQVKLREPLATQRDIFVFQCLIGCRVSDLWSMTKDNIIDGAVEYIPRKTKEGNPVTVRVPLTATAIEILERYKDYQGKGLFPFTSQQEYNRNIKEMFKQAGLNRIVTVLNPTNREEEKRPLYEIASSHLARRTFVGNLYKQVKDPNLICPMSGHSEGSKAFARYRSIDEDMKKQIVNLLE